MRNLKKSLALLVVIAMIAITAVPAFADTTSGNYTYSGDADKLHDMGLYDGTSTISFDPDLGSHLDRQTGVALLVKMFGKKSAALAMSSSEINSTLDSYSDKNQIDDWARPYAAYAIANGMIKGTSTGVYSPDMLLTSNMMSIIILRNLGYTQDDLDTALSVLKDKGGIDQAQIDLMKDKNLIKDWVVGMAYSSMKAKNSSGKTLIQTLVDNNVVTYDKAVANGLGSAVVSPTPATATPSTSVTPTGTVDPNATPTGTPVAITSNVTVSVPSDQIPARSIASGTNYIPMLKVNFAATMGDGKVATVKVQRTGLSNDSDVSGISLWDGATQLGTDQGLVNGYVTFNLANPLTIEKDKTKTLTIKASISGSAGVGNQVALTMVEAKGDPSTTVVSTSVPGSVMTIATFSASSSTISAAAAYAPASGNLAVGTDDQTLAAIRITVGGAGTTEDAILNSITLTRSGASVDTDLSNLKLYDTLTNTVVGTLTGCTGGRMTFTFASPISIVNGASKDFKLTGKLNNTAVSGGNLQVKVYTKTDIDMVGSTAGLPCLDNTTSFPVTVGGTATALNYVIANLTMAAAPTNYTATSVVRGANANMFKVRATTNSNEGVKFTSIKITDTLGAGAAASDISAITIEDDAGNVIASTGSPTTSGGVTSATVQFASQYEVPVGTYKDLTIKARFKTNASYGATATHTFSIAALGDYVATGSLSGKTLENSNKSGTPAGNAMTISQQGTLAAITNAASPVAGTTFVPGAKDVVFTMFDVGATSEDINLTTFTLTETATGNNYQYLTNIRLYCGADQVGNAVATGTATLTFTPSSSITVKAADKKTFTVKADTSTSFVNGNNASVTYSTVGAVGISSGATITAPGALTAANQTVAAPTLTFVTDASLTATTAIKGRNVTIGAVDATTTGDDIEITEMQVTARNNADGADVANAFGNGTTNYFGNCAAYVNGAAVSDVVMSPESNSNANNLFKITFTNALKVPKDQTTLIEIKADVLDGTSAAFKSRLTSVTSRAKSSQSSVTATLPVGAQSALITPAAAGTLAQADASTTVTASQEICDTDVTLNTFKLTASNEDMKLKSLSINFAAAVQNIGLKNIKIMDGTNVVTTYTPQINVTAGTNTDKTITIPSPYYILPKGTDKTLTVVGQFNDDLCTSAGTMTVKLNNSGATADGSSSQATITSGATAITAAAKTYVKAKAVVAMTSDSPKGDSSATSTMTFTKFTITANGGDITIPVGTPAFVFSGTTDYARFSNGGDQCLGLIDLSDNSIKAKQKTGGTTVLDVTSAITIPKGTTKTFAIKYHSATDADYLGDVAGVNVVWSDDATTNKTIQVGLILTIKDSAGTTLNDANNGNSTTFTVDGNSLKF